MAANVLMCWKCGATLEAVPRPLSRQALCPSCSAFLHVCRMCEFHDPRVSDGCTEERAEDVSDKTHVNFCDWFKARPNAHQPRDVARHDASRAKLDTLLGIHSGPKKSPKKALDDLFGRKKDSDGKTS